MKLPRGDVRMCADRREWLEYHHRCLSASRIAALFGESSWDSLYSLWAEMSGIASKEVEATIGMKRGSRFESALADEVRESTGWLVHQWPQNSFVLHDKVEKLGCTPDAILYVDGELALGDFKMTSEWNKKHWADESPGHYQMQMQCQMACCGIHRAYLLVAFGLHDEVTPVEVPYHAGFQKEMLKRVREFWRCVKAKEEPEVDGKNATFKALRDVYPEDDNTSIVLTGNDEMAARDYTRLGDEIKELTDLRDIAKAKLMLALKEHSYATTPGGLCYSYKATSRKVIDSKLLRKEHPEIAEQVTRCSSSRTLRKVKSPF